MNKCETKGCKSEADIKKFSPFCKVCGETFSKGYAHGKDDERKFNELRVRETIKKLSYITDEGNEYLEVYVPDLLVALGYKKGDE